VDGAPAAGATRAHPCRAGTSEFDVPRPHGGALELAVVLRNREEQLGEGGRLGAVEPAEALELLCGEHDDGALAVPGDELRLAGQRGVHDRAEAVLGVLERPARVGHKASLSS
jgi:hypothetical protein